jgi:excisionase family DNA binding protein
LPTWEELISNKSYLTVKFVAKLLDVSEKTIYRWIEEGEFGAVFEKNQVKRISTEAFRKFMKKYVTLHPKRDFPSDMSFEE